MEYKDIYNLIAKYYIIDKDNYDPEYTPFDSGRAIITNVVDNKLAEILSKAQDLVKEIELTFVDILKIRQGKQPVDTCYTVILSIATSQFENVTFTRELFCQFSMLSNYFCIYGKDTITLIDDNLTLYFDPIIIISPEDIYKEYYVKVRVMIEKIFPEYSFLPFIFLKKRITGLRVFTTFLKDDQYSSVYQTLFTPENLTDYTIRGNLF